jgi:hypothetical protein
MNLLSPSLPLEHPSLELAPPRADQWLTISPLPSGRGLWTS